MKKQATKAAWVILNLMLVAGCAINKPITSVIMVDGDENFLPETVKLSGEDIEDGPVFDQQGQRIKNSTPGLPIMPGDVLLLNRQSGVMGGAGTEITGTFDSSDVGVTRLPIRLLADGTSPSPDELELLTDFITFSRKDYEYSPLGPAERSVLGKILGMKSGQLWNAFVNSLRMHRLKNPPHTQEPRLVISASLQSVADVLPATSQDFNGVTIIPKDAFETLFISPDSARVELMTLTGKPGDTFQQILDASHPSETYGEVFGPKSEYKPRLLHRPKVLLNGVDFRVKDLSLIESHWSLEEVQASGICNDRFSNIERIEHIDDELEVRVRRLNVDKQCDYNHEIDGPSLIDTPIQATPSLDAQISYQYIPLDSNDNCGLGGVFRKLCKVTVRNEALSRIPIYSVARIKWEIPIKSTPRSPNIPSRCLAW